MWPAEPRREGSLWLFLGAQCVQLGLRSSGGWIDESLSETQAPCGDLGALAVQLAALGQAAQQQPAVARADRLRVVVSDHWLAAACVPWSAAQLSLESARRDAREHLLAGGHELEPQDDVRLDDGPAHQPRLALAFPEMLLGAVKNFAIALRIDEVVIASLSSVVAARTGASRQTAAPVAFAILEPCSAAFRSATLALLSPASGRVEQLVTRNLRTHSEAPWQSLEGLWDRLGWTRDNTAGSCAVMDATLAGEPLRTASPSLRDKWHPVDWLAAGRAAEPLDWLRWLGSQELRGQGALDIFLARTYGGDFRSTGTASPRAWQAIAVAALAALTAWGGWLALGYQSRLDFAREERDARLRNSVTQSPLPASSRERILAVNRVIAHLNLPLDDVLVAIQPPKDINVGLVGIEAAAGAQPSEARLALKIVAEASTSIDMTRYVSHLAERRPIVDAELARHELGSTPNGVPLYRFTVEVTWRP